MYVETRSIHSWGIVVQYYDTFTYSNYNNNIFCIISQLIEGNCYWYWQHWMAAAASFHIVIHSNLPIGLAFPEAQRRDRPWVGTSSITRLSNTIAGSW